jgi:hypothetical protein
MRQTLCTVFLSREAVQLNHAKLDCKCGWITEVKAPSNTAVSQHVIDFYQPYRSHDPTVNRPSQNP